MQREIKFRAWDEKNQKIVYHFSLNFPVSNLNSNVNYRWLLISYLTSDIDYCYANDVTSIPNCDIDLKLMQYTGVKDKNNIDIYEGDIVKFSDHYFGDSYIKEYIEVIEWDVCQWNDSLWVGYMDHPEWCEVIGNIYQNSELLNKEIN